jgi:ATP-dependent exoDNAse (exonuclease V) beta subunit
MVRDGSSRPQAHAGESAHRASRPHFDATCSEYRITREANRPMEARLTPGSDLWRYEEALERRGIPVATQAGKGFYWRQEVQDLISLTRVLADPRDTLALGALLRGPLVGLTDEELLDIVWSLPRSEATTAELPRLTVRMDAAAIQNTLARDVLEKLQSLGSRSHSTTPHELIAEAVDTLRVRPILLQRHGGQAERALANVDLFLQLARPYAVRGLRAFAEAITAAWEDEQRLGEGRPDALEESVSLYTMHSAKGLEWPVVVPVNTMTTIMPPGHTVVDRDGDCLYAPIFGTKPVGYDEVRDAEKDELERERVRLWYVAATRARELLAIPRLSVNSPRNTWLSLIDLTLSDLEALDCQPCPPNLLPWTRMGRTGRPSNCSLRKPSRSLTSTGRSDG